MEHFLKTQKDKIYHFSVSFLLMLVFYFLTKDANKSAILTILIGIGKEIYDTKKKKPTGFSFYDIIADGAGILTALMLLKIT